jgi:hypothetical protein
MVDKKKTALTKEEIESKITEITPRFAVAGSVLNIVNIEPPKIILRFLVPSTFPDFKVQGKLFGPKEFAAETQGKIKKKLETDLKGIVVEFID